MDDAPGQETRSPSQAQLLVLVSSPTVREASFSPFKPEINNSELPELATYSGLTSHALPQMLTHLPQLDIWALVK